MRPFVRCVDKSCALKAKREGKNSGSLAEVGLPFRGWQAILRAARRFLYLQ